MAPGRKGVDFVSAEQAMEKPAVLRVLEKVGRAAQLVSERTQGRVREASVSLTEEEGAALEEALRSFKPGVELVGRGTQLVPGTPVWARVRW